MIEQLSRPLPVARAAALAIIVGASAHLAPAAPPIFTSAVQLQSPPGTTTAIFGTDAISPVSGVTGSTWNGPPHALRWSFDGSVTQFRDLPSEPYGAGYGVNDLGQVVGWAGTSADAEMPARWTSDGSPTLLPLPGGAIGGRASAINNTGEIAGYARLSPNRVRAIRWAPDGTTTFLAVPGQTDSNLSAAADINEAGQVVGRADIGGIAPLHRAVRWEPDGSATLLNDPGQPGTSFVYAINGAGRAVGSTGMPNLGTRAVRWDTDGSATPLGDLPGVTTTASYGVDLSDTGLVVGYASLAGSGDRAVLWDLAGNPYLLQALVADGNSWVFAQARGISADSAAFRVVAYGYKNGGPGEYYLLSLPVPDPCHGALFGTLMLVVFSVARPRRFKCSGRLPEAITV